jgi:long-chain acyl-CoA synthetase
MNYCQALFELPSSHLGKVAFTELDTGARLTFGELQNAVLRWSANLRTRGIRSGDVVAIHLYNGLDFVVAHMAVQYIGAVSCLLDPLSQAKSLPYFLAKTSAKLLFTNLPSEQIPAEASALSEIVAPTDFAREASNLELPSLATHPFDWSMDATCYVYFTSGTTSAPKGVELCQANHENFYKIADKYWHPCSENSKHIAFVPFSHGFGSVFLIPWTIRTRSELHILRSFHPGKVVEAIEKIGITHIYGVPSHYQQLLRFPQYHQTLGKLEMAFCAAAKLESQTVDEWKRVTGTRLHEGYGLIETTGGVVWRVHHDADRTGHVGECPDPSLIEIGILDENGTVLPHGREGEIAVRGKSVMKGYLNQPDENARVFHDGWFRTGDKGFVDKNRQLFMTGRIKDIINIAGIKISPFEVEAVLNEHPEVDNAVVVAAEDKLYGEVVKAFILLKSGASASERDLIKYAGQHLINFQVPKQIEFVASFPLNNMGKVDRKALRST